MLLMIILLFYSFSMEAQQVTLTPEQIKGYTLEWKGEHFSDGRPKLSDKMLERLKRVHLEEAWGVSDKTYFEPTTQWDTKRSHDRIFG